MSTERSSPTENNIWLRLNRLDLPDVSTETQTREPVIKCVTFRHDLDGETVQGFLKLEFSIENDRIIRIRNQNGSLIPVGPNMKPNIQAEPYALEVVRIHQNVKPSPRSVKLSRYNETMRKKLESIEHRIENLEKATAELDYTRDQRMKTEAADLDQKLLFLNKRFDEAEKTSWKGMFKKPPLW